MHFVVSAFRLMGVDEPRSQVAEISWRSAPLKTFSNANDACKIYNQAFDQPKRVAIAFIFSAIYLRVKCYECSVLNLTSKFVVEYLDVCIESSHYYALSTLLHL